VEWGAAGFRSPACHRKFDWMKTGALQFSYDSSFPDTDPYQPMPGGCCSVFPWFLGGTVELPITLAQDHVVFDVLGEESTALWRNKTEYIESVGGMALLIVHPDYMVGENRLKKYEELLEYLKFKESAFCALPRDIARWWRVRANSSLVTDGDSVRVEASPDLESGDNVPEVAFMTAGSVPGELIVGSCAEVTS
jgi:hypothetical protein